MVLNKVTIQAISWCFLIICTQSYGTTAGGTQDQTSTRPNTLLDEADDIQRQLDNEAKDRINNAKPKTIWVLNFPTQIPILWSSVDERLKREPIRSSKNTFSKHRRKTARGKEVNSAKKVVRVKEETKCKECQEENCSNKPECDKEEPCCKKPECDKEEPCKKPDGFKGASLDRIKKHIFSRHRRKIARSQKVASSRRVIRDKEEPECKQCQEEPCPKKPECDKEEPCNQKPECDKEESCCKKPANVKKLYRKRESDKNPDSDKEINKKPNEEKEEPCSKKPKEEKEDPSYEKVPSDKQATSDENVPEEDWNYSNPSQWYKKYPECGGRSQSPVDLPVSGQLMVEGARKLRFCNYDAKPVKLRVENDGKRIMLFGEWGKGKRPLVYGGAAHSRRYLFYCLILHWPTEHTVGGLQYPVEVQALHVSADYGSLEQAIEASSSDPQAFLGIVNIYKFSPKTQIGLHQILKMAVAAPNDTSKCGPLSDFVPPFKSYACYQGSLPFPPCTESVLWLIRPKALPASRNVVEAAHNLLDTCDDQPKFFIRPTQPLNDRKIYYFK